MKTEVRGMKEIIQGLPPQDVVKFLEKGEFHNFILSGKKWSGPFYARIVSLQGFLSGYFSLKELFYLVLPRGRRTRQLREKFDVYINNRMKAAIHQFLNGDSVIGFSKEIFASKENLGVFELIDTLRALVIKDEYHARSLLKKDSIVIDAGANIGIFSLFAANITPDGEIYAFEPTKATFDILQKNAASYENIHCFQCGLGDKDAKKRFYIYASQTTGNTFEDSDAIGGLAKLEDFAGSEMAEITTIDNFVLKHKLPHVDFIKIDTEGYEAKILRGAKETIKKWHPILVMSAYHNPKDKEILPSIIDSISPGYKCRFDEGSGEELLFAEIT